jgi:DNA-binding GntR family transcriptional regulator
MSKPTSIKYTLHVKAYQEIKTKTIYLKPEPREKISENETAKYLKTSRTMVRKALPIPENEKLVERNHRLGVAAREFIYKTS